GRLEVGHRHADPTAELRRTMLAYEAQVVGAVLALVKAERRVAGRDVLARRPAAIAGWVRRVQAAWVARLHTDDDGRHRVEVGDVSVLVPVPRRAVRDVVVGHGPGACTHDDIR